MHTGSAVLIRAIPSTFTGCPASWRAPSRAYFRLRPQLKSAVDAVFETRDLEEQRAIYDARVALALWTRGLNWTLSRQITLSVLGVPHPQRKEVRAQHPQGVSGFVREAIEYVFRHLPAWNNYFWAVYLRGYYTRECCPEYLKPGNFAALKARLVRTHRGADRHRNRIFAQRYRRDLTFRAARSHGLDEPRTIPKRWPRNGAPSWRGRRAARASFSAARTGHQPIYARYAWTQAAASARWARRCTSTPSVRGS